MSDRRIDEPPSSHRYPLVIQRLLDEGVVRARDQEIVYAERKRLSYGELNERVGRLASGLGSLGVRRGGVVGVMDWDTHRYLECFFAIPMMGAVLHTINVRLSPEQILYTINHADDDLILVNREFLPLLEQIWPRVEGAKRLVLLDDGGGGVPGTSLPIAAEYEALLAGADPHYAFPELDEDTRATTFYTTGTTGSPKGVTFTHRQIVLHTMAVRAAVAGNGHGRFNPGDVYMPITPMFHVHAWGLPYVATTLGVKQVYPGRYAPESLLTLLDREKVTFSHCVPTILNMLLESAGKRGMTFAGWKVIIGGGALPHALARRALDAGVDVFSGYGMSETCPVLTLAHLERHMEAWPVERQVEMRTKTGRPIPMVQLRIVDEEMNDLPHDGKSAGELVVRAPWLTEAYLKDPESSRRLWAGGWLHTGDIAVIEPDGYLKITDRLKDVIKTGGEWVSSLALEELILQHPAVAEVAVIGVPDAKWTERPVAIVVARPGQHVDEAAIKALVAESASRGAVCRYAVPERVIFVEAIPKTSVGKLDKKALRATVGASPGACGASASTSTADAASR